MTYSKVWNPGESDRGIFRVIGICFEQTASDSKVEAVIDEVFSMKVLAPGFMTREALCLYLDAPQYVLKRMASMPIGSYFEFKNVFICRHGELVYSGKFA